MRRWADRATSMPHFEDRVERSKRITAAACLVAREGCVLKNLSTGPKLSGVKIDLRVAAITGHVNGPGSGILTVSGSVAPRLPNVLFNNARSIQCEDMASGSWQDNGASLMSSVTRQLIEIQEWARQTLHLLVRAERVSALNVARTTLAMVLSVMVARACGLPEPFWA